MKKLLKFSRVGCSPCVALENMLVGEEVPFESYDVESDLEMTMKYGVASLPTLILVDENGDALDRVVGFNRPQVESIIEKL